MPPLCRVLEEISVFSQRFGSSRALPGEWDGERSQVSSGELGGLQLGAGQLLCYLPQRNELVVLYIPCVSAWEASRRKQSPRA